MGGFIVRRRTELLGGVAAVAFWAGGLFDPSWAAAASPETPVATAPPTAEAAATDAAANPEAAVRLEGVTVTAERRSTNLQRTPLAITALSSQALDQSYTNQLSDLNAKVPSLEITHAAGFENEVMIRGVGYATPENSPTNTPGVAEFIDGVYVANTISLDQTLFDVDRIEVMRGPQGALYGESADGGAISIVTKQPRLDAFDASGDFSAGDYDLFRERLEVNVPVTSTVAVRLSAQAYDHSGFTLNEALPNTRLDDAHDMSGKLAILWKPNDAFSATFTGMVYHADQNGAAQKNIIEFNPAVLAVYPSLADPRTVYQDYPSTFDLTAQLYHVNLEWDLPWFVAKSVTAYQQLDHVQQEDGSRSAYAVTSLLPGGGFYDDVAGWNTKLQNYNEEFDLLSRPGSRLDWDVGAFVMISDISQFVAEFEGASPPPPIVIPTDIETQPPANLGFGQLADVNRQAYAGFFQATYRVAPRLRLTVGARINHDSYTPATYGFSGAVGGGPNPSPLHADAPGYTDTVPTFRAEGDYDLTPVNMVYASIARGYKPGGVNNNIDAVVVPHTFKYETNTAYEIGSKNTFLDRLVRLNLAAFYYDYRNFQYLEVDPFPFEYGTANVPSIHIYGVEGEGTFVSPDGRFRLNATAALENGFAEGRYTAIDSTVDNAIEDQPSPSPCAFGGAYYNPACWSAVEASAIAVQGKHPPDMPKLSGSLNASYLIDTPFGALTPYAEFIYRGGEWARIFNDPALDHVGAYGVWNFNLQFVPDRSRLKFSLAVTNAFNVAGVNSRYTDPYGSGQTSQQYIPPRQVVGVVAFAF